MQSLYLHVKNRIRINVNTIVLFNIFCKTHLVLALNLHKILLCRRAVSVLRNPLNHRKVHNPILANLIGNPVRKQRICMKKETSLRNAVCLIIELRREHLVEVLQLLVFQDFRMKPCHTVYTVSCNNCQMRHLHLTVGYNCHFLNLVSRLMVSVYNIEQETAVNLFNNLINSRKQSLE